MVHLFFSPRGETKKIASIFHQQLGGTIIDLTLRDARETFDVSKTYETLIISCPVYSATFPNPLRDLFSSLKCQKLVINATYGGMTHGNMIADIAKLVSYDHLIGYTATPTMHAYLNHPVEINPAAFNPLIEKLQHTMHTSVSINHKKRYLWLHWFEPLRTRFNYRLRLNKEACTSCGRCLKLCPTQSINTQMTIDNTCIRCSRCVHVCPHDAWKETTSYLLKRYLTKHPKDNIEVVY